MKISIVTISFNQAHFLEQAIQSVLDQDYPNVEYIVVDAGSTDGSRQIIERYRNRIDRIIFAPDQGPADGLNKGFAYATGDIFGFLNSDDFLLTGAISRVASAFAADASKDVISGHAVIVGSDGCIINRLFSRRFSPVRYLYGASTIAQQSTFFRREAFRRAGGFNVCNRVAWDGELWVDMALTGSRFGLIHDFLSAFRIYDGSITGGGKYADALAAHYDQMFLRVMGRSRGKQFQIVRAFHKVSEYLLHPSVALERIRKGAVVRSYTE